MVNFQSKVRENCLYLVKHELTDKDVGPMMEFIGQNPQINALDLGINEISDEGLERLTSFPCLAQLNTLSVYCNKVGPRGCKAIADSEYSINLTTLSFNSNEIQSEGVGYIANSQYLINLNTLSLIETKIDADGAKHIAASTTLNKNLTIHLGRSKILGPEGIITLAKWASNNQNCKITIYDSEEDSNTFISTISQACKENSGIMTPEVVKDLIFKLAVQDESMDQRYVKYLLDHPEEYPFLINSVDRDGNTLADHYRKDCEMRKFLFKHGLICSSEQPEPLKFVKAFIENNQNFSLFTPSVINKIATDISIMLVNLVKPIHTKYWQKIYSDWSKKFSNPKEVTTEEQQVVAEINKIIVSHVTLSIVKKTDGIFTIIDDTFKEILLCSMQIPTTSEYQSIINTALLIGFEQPCAEQGVKAIGDVPDAI